MSNSLDPYSNIDIRTNFTNYFYNQTQGISYITANFDPKLNITVFREKFNNMLKGLSWWSYYMEDMIGFYYGEADTVITHDDYSWKNDDFLVNQLSPNNNYNKLSHFILKMIISCLESNNYLNNSSVYNDVIKQILIINLKSDNNLNSIQIKNGIDDVTNKENFDIIKRTKIFELYDYIVEVEKFNNQPNNIKIYYIKNFIVINILKYFFLSEMLLRALLDTNENVDKNCSVVNVANTNEYYECNIIRNDYINENDNLGMKNPGTADLQEKEDMTLKIIYKILKDITFINDFFKKNNEHLIKDNSSILIGRQTNNEITTKETELNTLNNDIININKNITELNLKNLNMQKDFEKKKNMYYIIIVFIIIYIFSNLYIIVTQNINSLLTLNILLIILIVVVKFLSLIKKSYQTLVQDL